MPLRQGTVLRHMGCHAEGIGFLAGPLQVPRAEVENCGVKGAFRAVEEYPQFLVASVRVPLQVGKKSVLRVIVVDEARGIHIDAPRGQPRKNFDREVPIEPGLGEGGINVRVKLDYILRGAPGANAGNALHHRNLACVQPVHVQKGAGNGVPASHRQEHIRGPVRQCRALVRP